MQIENPKHRGRIAYLPCPLTPGMFVEMAAIDGRDDDANGTCIPSRVQL